MIILEDVLSQEIIQKLGWTLLHFIWQASVLAILLAILLRVLRKSTANLRYIIACIALTLIVLLPVITIKLVPVSAPQSPAHIEPAPVPAVLLTEEMPPAETIVLEEPVQPESVTLVSAVSWKQRAVDTLEPALPYIVSGWLVGVFGLSIWHLGGWAQLQRLRRKMVKQVNDNLHSKLKDLAERLKVNRMVQLVESALVQIPTVVGWLRPVILLPASALTGLSAAQLEAILAHELAHIKRFDYLLNMLQTVVEILGFYHPAVWWVSHKIRAERENCCDDLAVSISGDRVCYARALTSMEEIRTGQGQLAVAATGGNLFRRIRRLLGKDSAEKTSFSWVPAVTVILLIIAFVIPTTLTLTVQAQTDAVAELEEKPTKSLREAATDGDIDQIRLHLSIGTAVNAKEKKGRTALHNAARQGHTEIARLLIARSANVNAKTKNGQTPLHDAAYCGNGEIAELLIVKGADVNAWDKNGQTPLSLALKSTGGGREVVDLLLSKGIIIPALHLAAYRDQLKNVRQSLDKRWQVNARDEGRRTALHYAVSRGQMRVVELLIARGADVNAKNKISETPLYYAACVGGRNVAELLISKGADVNAKDRDWGLTPLHAAASRGYPEITELLITNGANVMAKDEPSDYTPLHGTAWYKDKVPGTVAVAKILLDKGADVDAKTTWNGTTLTEAADSDNVAIAKLLIDKGADVDAACMYGCTPLWHTVIEGHKDMAELLISNGADVNAQTNQVSTPLHRAVLNNDKDMVELLLANGAKFDVKDHRGFTAFRMAAREGSRDIVELFVSEGADVSTFHLTACMGDLIRVKSLVEQGTDVDAKDELGWTPLYWATSMGRTRVAEFLVSRGTDVTLQTEDGNTPLHKAAEAGEQKLVEFFVSKGADVNAQDKRGNTPLHSAVSAGHVAIADFLIAKGASVNMKSTINWTSLHAAAWYGHEAIVELLVTKGADVDVKDHGYGRTPLQWAKQRGHTEIFNLLRKHGAKE